MAKDKNTRKFMRDSLKQSFPRVDERKAYNRRLHEPRRSEGMPNIVGAVGKAKRSFLELVRDYSHVQGEKKVDVLFQVSLFHHRSGDSVYLRRIQGMSEKRLEKRGTSATNLFAGSPSKKIHLSLGIPR